MDTYDDIIHLPHHRSKKRGHMSLQDRAAQFSPFAALTGFDSAIEETGRLTDSRPELMEYGNTQLNRTLSLLTEQIAIQPSISVTYFLPDGKKSGGHCITLNGQLKKVDAYRGLLILTEGEEIPLADILHIDSPCIEDFSEQ